LLEVLAETVSQVVVVALHQQQGQELILAGTVAQV
jgi:hypothetical protein